MSRPQDFSLPINPRYGTHSVSWSDLVAIEQNPKAWLEGKRLKSNQSMDFGTFVHAQIKHRHLTTVPVGNAPEKVYSAKISNGKQSFTIIGKPDDTDEDTIYEYKSGLKLWNRKQAETHGQLFTYALLKWKATGKLPKKALLISLETRYDEDCDGIVLTGKQVIHEVPITLKDVLKIQARFVKAVSTLSALPR